MLEGWFIIVISLSYVGLLFAIAYYGDNHSKELLNSKTRPLVYSLSLSVYATSWTFYGAVGRASSNGWEFLATYLGPIITFMLAWQIFTKIIRVSKQQNITTISDFVASRYGKSQSLAVLVTCIAVLGIVPYIALQLKAVAISYNALTSDGGATAAGSDTALFVALLMALFSILFGTRHIDATEHHEGIVLAIAFESLVKIAAFIAVGFFVTFGIFDGFDDLFTKAANELAHNENFQRDFTQNSFLTETLLATVAIICLPRQFHVAVVENADPKDLRTARWVFPIYLILASLFVLPIATAGMLSFPDGSVDADTFVLTLPLFEGKEKLAMFAFIGGLSAATSMVIVATITLSTMVCNDIVMPMLLRVSWLKLAERKDLGALLLKVRRLTIVNLMLLAYFYYRILGDEGSLASFGLLAFVAVAQFAPAIFGAVSWKGGSRQGALAGISIGSFIWIYTLVIPTMSNAGLIPDSLVSLLWGSHWLQPDALFGIKFADSLTHGTFWSLTFNISFYLIISHYSSTRLIDRIQASTYVDVQGSLDEGDDHGVNSTATVGDLQLLAERFLGLNKAQHAFTGFSLQRGEDPLLSGDKADADLIAFTERLLAGVIGASSARILIASTLRGKDMQVGDVVTIVDEASQVLKFNRALLQSTIENISQGISVVDQQMRLVAWNRRYLEMFDYPEGLICIGRPAAEIFRYNAKMGEYSPGDIEEQVSDRLAILTSGKPHSYIRYRKDGTVLEVQGNPMPGGGYVNTYMDITAHKRTEEALRESEQSIRIYTDNVPVLIAYLDCERRYLFVNKSYAEAFGIEDRLSIYGTPCYKVLTEEEYAVRTPFITRVLKGERARFETELTDRNNRIRYADVTYIPHVGEYGDILGYFTLYQDITERRQAELALQETNENLEHRVHERTHAISAINKELRKENTIRALIEDELRQAKAEAEAANLGKTRFLAAASHDLLQPLNAARLFASALGQQAHSEATSELVTNLDGSLKAAEELLVTLLDISKLDAGALEPNFSHFKISNLLSTLQAEFTALANEKSLKFHSVNCHAVVHSDQQLLRRVLQNFLSNAIRYTQSGKILLGCRYQGKKLRIEVWDTGVGIPESKIKEVFEEFRRIDNPRHSQVKGLGLGLAITDRISRMLKHPLKVRSWPGKGTVFSIEVPFGDPSLVVQRKQTKEGNKRSSNLAGIKVLCIDNEPNILEGMSALLKGWSCETLTALGEEDALKQCQENSYLPDLILADYHLSDTKTGIMALKSLFRLWNKAIPAIVITADRTDEVQEEVRIAGAQMLHKPMKPAALRAMMTTIVARQK
ncbi:NahK/ErcS family hybrid sensor histidine kinase/response regulator [Motiliproteus sp. MSK22-1]|uniref:hybrid sensor histidine kinase/response regulator n=1 Tax=Motiliproteus sp. MSK22-1 TaxID=1897630 RepID=UPI000978586D|nr:NahK/ErcS family hybrid sensor histidine kinase/response regulator [Motiliproteus sp. MSK22-1]OMH30027.1 hybrid sensor histidine kinase/response regulator [Motiliproteus sp. MSK22-1]